VTGKQHKVDRSLTEVELELMTIIWRLGEGTVSDVLAELPSDRQLAYTSVSTIMRILQDKGILDYRKDGRSHIYVPAVTKAAYEAHSVRQLVRDVFAGAPGALVRCLVDNEQLSRAELDAIRAMLTPPASAAGKQSRNRPKDPRGRQE
jgi:predicted transcriptional regulator